MRVRASLWATMAAVTLLSPAVLIARLSDMDVGHVFAASFVFLPKHPPLPQPRKSAPVPPPEERAQVQPPAPAPAVAPATLLPLGMARDRPEEIAQVPDHFFWLRTNVMAAQDAVDGQLVFFDDAGRVTGRTVLPSDFHIAEVAASASAVRLIDRAGRRQMSIARTADPTALRSLPVTPVPADRSTRTARVTRSSPEVLQLQDESDTRAKPLEVRSLTNAPLAFTADHQLIATGALFNLPAVVLVLRHTRPDLPRAFRVPFVWVVCPLGAAACLFLFWQAFVVRWWLILGWTAIGFLIYGFYGYRNSKLRQNAH